MPGEQWLMLDSPQAAEAYLGTYSGTNAIIQRETFPNAEYLYARIRFPNQIPQHRVYITAPTEALTE